MKTSRIDIASIRKEQILSAAVAVIAEQGLQNLSLSEIENKAGMSRGQLTYYFPAKEDILLAVFDRLLQLMYERVGAGGQACEQSHGWDMVRHLLEKLVGQPPPSPEFHCLQYTFLSQIGHRDDFRQRLARLYEEWRSNMALGLANSMAQRPPVRKVSPRALATIIQALLHGLAMQWAADPEAFEREEMLALVLDLLGTYLWGEPAPRKQNKAAAKKPTAANSAQRRNGTRHPSPRRG